VRESWVRYLAWIMVVSFPISMVMADATSAILIANGSATVNGSPIERATAVFPGDKVQTGPNTVATLTSQGLAVTVTGNSTLVFSKSFVNVLCGTALVSTRRGMPARVSNLLVQPPRGEPARFEIIQNEGQLQIIARQGTLAIDNGATTTSLQPGRMLTAHATCMAAPYADDQTGSSTSSTATTGSSTPSTATTGSSPSSTATTGGSNYSPLVLLGLLGLIGGGTAAVLATTGSGSSSQQTCASTPCTTPGSMPVSSR